MFNWTETRIEQLRTMWLDEGLSASQIGARLGTTRNSVIGKVHRLGLRLRPAEVRKRKTEVLFGSSPWLAAIKPPRRLPETIVSHSERCNLEDLEAFDLRCRYPHGDGPPYQFCGQTRIPGSSYCLAHLQACYTQPPPRAAAFVEQQLEEVSA